MKRGFYLLLCVSSLAVIAAGPEREAARVVDSQVGVSALGRFTVRPGSARGQEDGQQVAAFPTWRETALAETRLTQLPTDRWRAAPGGFLVAAPSAHSGSAKFSGRPVLPNRPSLVREHVRLQI